MPRSRSSTPVELTGSLRHGTVSAYRHQGCGCDDCRAAVLRQNAERRAYHYARRILRRGRLYSPDAPQHGTRSGYTSFGCRCGPCTAAHCRKV